MEEQSTTGQVSDQSVADNSSTTETATNPAESQAKQESIDSNANESQSNESANNKNESEDETAALSKFAKGQGINDLSELSERELSLLKMARDNKSAYDKSKQHTPKLSDQSDSLIKASDDASDVQKLASEVYRMKYDKQKSEFFADKDKSLEPTMVSIVEEKRAKFGDEFAKNLLLDLPTLYSLAQIKKGAVDTNAIAESARQEERNSMNKSLSAGSSTAHAIDKTPKTNIKVTSEWIMNEYDPSNPEHRALVDSLTKQ